MFLIPGLKDFDLLRPYFSLRKSISTGERNTSNQFRITQTQIKIYTLEEEETSPGAKH